MNDPAFDPTAYASNSFAPAPGTSTQSTWSDFINGVVRGTTQIIAAAKGTGTNGTGGYGGTDQQIPTAAAAGSGMALIVIVVLLIMVLD